MTDGWRDVRLPEDLCAAAEKKYGQQFGSVDQFLQLVLRDLLQDEAFKLDQDERRVLEERLRALGYI